MDKVNVIETRNPVKDGGVDKSTRLFLANPGLFYRLLKKLSSKLVIHYGRI